MDVMEMKKSERIFNHYKGVLIDFAINGPIRMPTIEYVCQFPGIDPVEMAKSIVKSGFTVVFDDSSIKAKENERKRRAVYGR